MEIEFFVSDFEGPDFDVWIKGRFICYMAEKEIVIGDNEYIEVHVYNNFKGKHLTSLISKIRWDSNERMGLRREAVEEYILMCL